MPHLWQPEHPYYCSTAEPIRGTPRHFIMTWAEFKAWHGDSDRDYNLVFRWDWMTVDDGEGAEPGEYLFVYVFRQRQCIFVSYQVRVTPDDEAEVRDWLTIHWAHLMRMWAPISDSGLSV